MIKKSKIPTLIALFLLVMGIVAGVFLVRNNQVFRLKATPNLTPQDVRISNITDTSFTVSWATQETTTGVIKWGKSATDLNQPVNEELTDPGFIHSASVKPLTPVTTYYFNISAGGVDYSNNGLPWTVTTGPTLSQPPSNLMVSGTVMTPTGSPVTQALVYLTVGGGSLLSSLTSQNGSYLIPISATRNKDLVSYVSVDSQHSTLDISVNAGPDGVASAQAYPQAASPLPPLILGQVQDFKNLPANQIGEVPNADLTLPQNETTPVSGFTVDTKTPPAQTSKSVTLDSVADGEVVTTVNPEFFGKGPSGTTINIKVESEVPVTDSLKIPTNQTWTWSPPAGLAPGNHTITITWKDAQGILRTLSKNFVISAAEGPAFESTPSATLKPSSLTIQPTATPKATVAPTSTPLSTLAPLESPIATATPNIPVSGDLTPTLLLFMMSLGVISFSVVLWRKSEI